MVRNRKKNKRRNMSSKHKYLNKLTPEDLKELKDKMWTKLIYNRDASTSTEPVIEAQVLKETNDKFYLAYVALSPLDRIKKWYYGEKKFNRLLLEKRNSNV